MSCPRPCKSCPFTPQGVRGGRIALWDKTPEEAWEALKGEGQHLCVEACVLPPTTGMVDLFTSSLQLCAGAYIAKRQMGKLPRNKEEADFSQVAEGEECEVFKSKQEFVAFHQGGPLSEDQVTGSYETRINRLKEALVHSRKQEKEALDLLEAAGKKMETAENEIECHTRICEDTVHKLLSTIWRRIKEPHRREALVEELDQAQRMLERLEVNTPLYEYWEKVRALMEPPIQIGSRKFRRAIGKEEESPPGVPTPVGPEDEDDGPLF